MANKKPVKNVASMAILKDIRGLLSSNHDQVASSPDKKDVELQKKQFEQQIQQYQDTITKLQANVARLEADNQELAARLNTSSKTPATNPGIQPLSPNIDIADLEARKEELSNALSRIEDLLQFKTKELIRRIARVYEEAGDFNASRDFRRITNQLEAAENFGEFLRALTRE
jgi:hypothetical protein